MKTCPVCSTPVEIEVRHLGRAALDGDLTVCDCATVLVVRGAGFAEASVDDVLRLPASHIGVLQHMRERAAIKLRRAQRGAL